MSEEEGAEGSSLLEAEPAGLCSPTPIIPSPYHLPAAEQEAIKKSYGLTARECEVLRFVMVGETNTEIGARLSVSVKTVEAHRSRAFRKLGVLNAAAATALALTLTEHFDHQSIADVIRSKRVWAPPGKL